MNIETDLIEETTISTPVFVAVHRAKVAGRGAIGLCDFIRNNDVDVVDEFEGHIIFSTPRTPSLSEWREQGMEIVEIADSLTKITSRIKNNKS